MERVLMFNIPVPDLVDLIADEVEKRLAKPNQYKIETPISEERLHGDKSAANHIGCTVQTVGRLRRDKEIPSHKFGRKYYYYASEIDAALKVEARRFGELRRSKAQC